MQNENYSTVDIQGLTYKIGWHGLPYVRTNEGEWRKTTREVGEIRKAIEQKRGHIPFR